MTCNIMSQHQRLKEIKVYSSSRNVLFLDEKQKGFLKNHVLMHLKLNRELTLAIELHLAI